MADILFPPGRMIGGNLDQLFPRTESNGTPKIGKDGKPEMQCSVGYAIPKGVEKAWWETAWGAEIYQIGAAAHPNLVQSPAFSWKITDGDSTLPNKKGNRPCDQTGYPGHWVIWFSQGWLPKRVNSDGTVELPEGSIVPGYYVQMYGSVAGNKLVPNGTPGVYLNPIAVALVGEGDKIAQSVDTTAVGFGAAPLPAGARPVSPVVPGMPAMGVPAAPGAAPAPTMPTPPAPGAVAPPTPPAPAPVAPAGPVMLPAANGVTYEAYRTAGWTDQQLIDAHMMQAPVAAPAPVVPPTAPHTAFLTPGAPAPGGTPPAPPAAPVAPPAAPAAPVAPAHTMTAKAAGVPYETFVQQGWTDQQLREQGYML